MSITLGTIQILDEERYPIEGNLIGRKLVHVVTLGKGTREFVLIMDTALGGAWLNEVIGGTAETIDDDELFKDLWKFLYDNNFITVNTPEAS